MKRELFKRNSSGREEKDRRSVNYRMQEGKETRLNKIEYEHLTDQKTPLFVSVFFGYNLPALFTRKWILMQKNRGGVGGGLGAGFSWLRLRQMVGSCKNSNKHT
jgi:hypothetical protein